ncbi:hypothetical protein DFJ58DRAFT_669610 [Suillus subalutaceus]|uniref:uncharacterized protein n=1 Tax=Suillus subalutaceus TaxID=48586 RepID=UPI001B86F358|nr:uncharacterized protein DFJ58DRAFT_669610 [Suillus subalutaceus]KAG1836542.1 hypothetical protein DFJ58DRAFT_669610 [Suillus subalutaceus]
MLNRYEQPYCGLHRTLVLAFDMGITHSSISYCMLTPGEVPIIRSVARYPGQEHVGGDSKIPSLLYYNTSGIACAIGAETQGTHVIESAEEEGWVKLEWCVWQAVHPPASYTSHPSLPRGKNVIEVLGDFMQYLFRCARTYIEESHCNLWRSIENHIEFVLIHPNDWKGPQQRQIWLAAVLSGLVSNTAEDMARVHLLTEGEAKLHYCIYHSILASDTLSQTPIVASDSQGIVIIDAGNWTIDLNAYSVTLYPLMIEEIAPAERRLQGYGFVTRRAREKLSGSCFGTPEIVLQMTDIFDMSTKLRFRNPEESSFIKFGTIRDKDPQFDIRNGQLKLNGQDVAELFEPSIASIIEAFETQRMNASIPITIVSFMGDFAMSDWMFIKLQEYIHSLGIAFSRPDSHCNKAVADGAVLYYIEQLASSRAIPVRAGDQVGVVVSFPSASQRKFRFAHPTDVGALSLTPYTPRAYTDVALIRNSKTVVLSKYLKLPCHSTMTAILNRYEQPYIGLHPKLVLAFDIGITHSSISYCILTPGKVPIVGSVNRYPGQEHVGGDSKIPSLLYYNTSGIACAIGAETQGMDVIERAEEEGWVKLEWWKLHLQAVHPLASDISYPPLPRGKHVIEVLGDFMQYLLRCARTYIQESQCDVLWRSLENCIEFVFTYPNGWGDPQQRQFWIAAVLGGLVSNTAEDMARVHLLTEGEAKLHYCIHHNVLASGTLSQTPIVASDSQGIVIIDAGNWTIDLYAYSMTLSPLMIEEIAPAECRLQGYGFVTRRARGLLQGSRFGTPEIVLQMTDIFDMSTTLRFCNPEDPSYIKFGTMRDKDPQFNIRNGQLKLNGQDVAELFEPSIASIIEAFETQRMNAGIPITIVSFMGDFAVSEWMFARLQEYFHELGIAFSRPDNHYNKAVADGAVLYYIEQLVAP